MKKISLIALLSLTLLLSGCLKFTPQAEFDAQQKASSSSAEKDSLSLSDDASATDSLSLGSDAVKSQDVTTNVEVKAEIEGSIKTIEEGKTDVPQKPEATAPDQPTASPATEAPTPSVTVIPLDEIWKGAEFKAGVTHSYEVNYPDSLTFSTFEGGAELRNDSGKVLVQMSDYALRACDDGQAVSECKILSPGAFFEWSQKQIATTDWKLVNKNLTLLQVKKSALQYQKEGGFVRYLVQLDSGVLSIIIDPELARDTNFVKLLLKSLKSA